MKTLQFLGGSLTRSIKRKPWFTLLLILTVVVSVVSSGFVVKLMRMADPSYYEHDGIVKYSYSYDVNSDKGYDALAEYAQTHPNVKIQFVFEKISNGYAEETPQLFSSLNGSLLFDIRTLKQVNEIIEYTDELTNDNLASTEKRVLISKYQLDEINRTIALYPEIFGEPLALGDGIVLADEEYRIIGIYNDVDSDDVYLGNFCFPYGAISPVKLSVGGNHNKYSWPHFMMTSTNRRISKTEREALESEMDVTYRDYGGVKFSKWLVAVLMILLWALNIYFLFKNYLKRNDSYYDVYKVVGIPSWQLFLSMFLETVLITLAGFFIGWGIDAGISATFLMFGMHMYLQPSEVWLLFACNFVVILTTFAVACVKKIKSKPLEGE